MERLRQAGAPLATSKRLEKAQIEPMKLMTIDKKSTAYRYHTGIYVLLMQDFCVSYDVETVGAIS